MEMSKRKQKFVSDAKTTEEICMEQSIPFTDFTTSEQTFSFSVSMEMPRFQKCTVCVTEDYPENSFVCKFGETEETEITSIPLPQIILKLYKELTNPVEKMDQSMLTVPSLTSRSISMESSGSSYMDCKSTLSSEEEEEDMDYYYKNDGDTQTSYKPCSVLERDMEKLQDLYGDAALSYRLLDAIDEIDIQINLPLSSIIDEPVADAWKLNRDEPLSIFLHLSYTNYLDSPSPPKIEVFQTPRHEKNGIASQMQKIMETFVFHQWPKHGNKKIEEYHKRHEVIYDQEEVDEPTQLNDKDLARIMEIGFSAEQARDALIISRGDFLQAVNDLFANKDSAEAPSALGETNKPKLTPKTTERQNSVPHKNTKKKKVFRQQSHGGTLTKKTETLSTTADLHLKPSSSWFGKNSKRIPEPEFGFLVQIFQYARQRLPTLNEFCVVCDEPHVFQNGAMLKPAVCSRELCVFAFQTLGVMSDAAEDIATAAEVVDLLLSMTRAASENNRRNIILDPYPTVVDPDDPNELALNPKDKDFDKVGVVMKQIMSMKQMVMLSPGDIKKTLDQKNKLCYPLLQWIISSNRSYIVKLPKERRLTFMKTPFQYLLLSSPPAKEATFRDAKEKFGSTFAFHGSSVENWHSIIRQGLIVASGTNKQVNGAAYGKGIYLSPNAGTSFGYSRMYGGCKPPKNSGDSSDRFLQDGGPLFCIALCEVITSPSLKKSGQIWVCPESDHVCTRFFFVYEAATVHDNIDTQQKLYEAEILKAVNYKS